MLYLSHAPAPPLSHFIDRFWLCSDAPPHDRERILPSGTIELVVNLREDEIRIYDPSHPDRSTRFSGAVVSGTYSRFFVIDPLQHASILGVHFKPGGAFPFLGAPAGELADFHVDLEDLWGAPARELRERLCAAATPAERFFLLEKALLSRLGHPLERHGAVPVALDALEPAGEVVRVRDVARRVGLSQRRFIQVFAAEVGLTPKLYHRVRRFQRARARVRKDAAPDWARLAVDCGYFDQSHLIRDFLAFSGLSPADYLLRRSERVLPNHVPLPG
ncbi:MAG TPA: helix-turn-helix domain-containing protein [Thermoanaerobaculia bacterium]|nr:helix-turn-helix domain-containing protein [Thermoanaerobaculia bacterium]